MFDIRTGANKNNVAQLFNTFFNSRQSRPSILMHGQCPVWRQEWRQQQLLSSGLCHSTMLCLETANNGNISMLGLCYRAFLVVKNRSKTLVTVNIEAWPRYLMTSPVAPTTTAVVWSLSFVLSHVVAILTKHKTLPSYKLFVLLVVLLQNWE